MSFKITWKTHLNITLAAYIAVKVLDKFVTVILDSYIQKMFLVLTGNVFLDFYAGIMVLMIPISIIHELIHGLAYNAFGGKVRYGFKVVYAYTQEISVKAIGRTEFQIILLAPLMVISIFTLLMPGWLGGILFLLNLLGSCGDIYMSVILMKYDYNSKIIDRSYGFDVVCAEN